VCGQGARSGGAPPERRSESSDLRTITLQGVKNTLKMLYNENNRRGKELQRKIQKMRDEGKDPSIPFGIKRTQSPQILTGGLRIPRHDSPSRGFRSQDSAMLTSQRTLDDSYMVLGSRVSYSPSGDVVVCSYTITERPSRSFQPLLDRA